MKKETAIELLGGTPTKAARLIGITTQAIASWPEELPRRIADRVIAARVRYEWQLATTEAGIEALPCPDVIADALRL